MLGNGKGAPQRFDPAADETERKLADRREQRARGEVVPCGTPEDAVAIARANYVLVETLQIAGFSRF